jgi:hypothetical protein
MRFHAPLVGLVQLSLLACGDGTSPSTSLAGSYVATDFRVTPTGQASIDVLGAGGTLSIAIAANNTTTGSLNVPGSVTGGAPFTASMAGTAMLSGSTVTFQQSADTFVRDLSWTRSGTTLSVTNQAAGSATYTIVLMRQ